MTDLKKARHFILITLLTGSLAACSASDNDKNNRSNDSAQAPETTETTESNNDSAAEKKTQVEVSAAAGHGSAAISESAGNAAENKNDELYIVPNQSPIDAKEAEAKAKEESEDSEDSEDKQDPPKS